MAEQNYANHRRLRPFFHFATQGILLINFVFAVVHLWKHHAEAGFPYGQIMGVLLAIALILLSLFARVFATTVQDRVIRLEEALRYQKVLPADLQSRTAQLTLRQIIGLRFASDAELPALVRRALDEKLSENQIKKEVKNWKSDTLRA